MTFDPRPVLASLCALALIPSGLAAQEEIGAQLMIELNAAVTQGDACKLSFLVLNGHPADISGAVFETVLFDAAGQVERLTLFDFGALPSARPRVRQFVVPDIACEDLGQILFNGADTCAGDGIDARACETDLRLESRTGIKVTG
jgi:hypothetical protein